MAQRGEHLRRPIKKLLVANRGEIAARILSTARELGIETYALSSENDVGHTSHADHVIKLESAADYMSVPKLTSLAKEHGIDAVHPGYGFLSESTEFAKKMVEEVNVLVVGPGWQTLDRTGDKLMARKLAESQNVPCLPAMMESTGDLKGVEEFVRSAGLPVMLKAVDGGGGRGIRLVRRQEDLAGLAKRAIEESPSKRVFAEKAAVDNFRHIEVQIIGDGTGNVRHLWERECSIQRRYQKIVELAPSTVDNRAFISNIIKAAVLMAQSIRYLSLGTFEFLANPETKEFFFLEINPRLQVEHTITESISNLDIVAVQLAIAQGASLKDALPPGLPEDPQAPPPQHSIQLRITAENAHADFSLSIGKITSFAFPSGNGIRIDTALISGHSHVVSADFDSLLAKIIVTAPTWETAVRKARRALEDTRIDGVKTNLNVLRGIIASDAFAAGKCDTTWLETNIKTLVDHGDKISQMAAKTALKTDAGGDGTGKLAGLSSGTIVLRKGDAYSIRVGSDEQKLEQHHLKLTKVIRNELPSSLTAQAEYTTPAAKDPTPVYFELKASSASAGSVMSADKHRRGNPANPAHVIIPFSGKLVEVLVDEGDQVAKGDVVCVVQQMKMELEVRASRAGRVTWVTDAQDGEDVAEGMLAAEVEEDASSSDARAKL